MPFSLVVPKRPPSSNKGKKATFQDTLNKAAISKYHSQTPMDGRLYCRLVWFHSKPTTQDIDNIPKNILDSLKGVIFRDDVAVVRCLLAKINSADDFEIDQTGIDEDSYNSLMKHCSVESIGF
jgi:Holliday junction resolvase RusA-like endonuclease